MSAGESWCAPGRQARTSASGASRTRSTRPTRSTSSRPASARARSGRRLAQGYCRSQVQEAARRRRQMKAGHPPTDDPALSAP
jgi:hypothetical protein